MRARFQHCRLIETEEGEVEIKVKIQVKEDNVANDDGGAYKLLPLLQLNKSVRKCCNDKYINRARQSVDA